ncbi:hypothetical protein JHK87_043297 [Glycine soja]|nr:hypothetical protein JHK87_043297 [Glycine soja]
MVAWPGNQPSLHREDEGCRSKDFDIIENVKRELEQCEAGKKALEKKEIACKESLARAQDESTKISETMTNVKSKESNPILYGGDASGTGNDDAAEIGADDDYIILKNKQ